MVKLAEAFVRTLIPPFRFSAVEEGLYRGAHPTLKNFRFLRRLRLKTIISVTPELPTSDVKEFCNDEKVAPVQRADYDNDCHDAHNLNYISGR